MDAEYPVSQNKNYTCFLYRDLCSTGSTLVENLKTAISSLRGRNVKKENFCDSRLN